MTSDGERYWPKLKICKFSGSQSAWVAITKYHRLGDLNNRYLFLTVPEAGKYRLKVPANSVRGDGTLPGTLLTVNSPDGERKLWCLVLFYKGTNPITGVPSSWPHLNLTTFQRPHLQYHHTGVSISTHECWGDTNIPSIAGSNLNST